MSRGFGDTLEEAVKSGEIMYELWYLNVIEFFVGNNNFEISDWIWF